MNYVLLATILLGVIAIGSLNAKILHNQDRIITLLVEEKKTQ